MKKLSLVNKIFFAIILGIFIGLGSSYINTEIPVKILVTFNSLFGSLLSFLIPLIIIGFIVPGIASLGNKSGKGLLVTTLVPVYILSIFAKLSFSGEIFTTLKS